MTKLEQIIADVTKLDSKELAKLSDWFAEFHSDQWDREIEADAKAGGLDSMAAKALADHKAGRTRPL
jgi:hypothetical protein